MRVGGGGMGRLGLTPTNRALPQPNGPYPNRGPATTQLKNEILIEKRLRRCQPTFPTQGIWPESGGHGWGRAHFLGNYAEAPNAPRHG